MKLPTPLHAGRLIKRYKRFLADIQLESGEVITAHCPNSGSMLGCAEPGSQVIVSQSDNPSRKLAYTWQLVKVLAGWVGINTGLPNRLVPEGIINGQIEELGGYTDIRSEVPYGLNSRIDLLLRRPAELCYVEIKNVTLRRDKLALFPDSVTTRGQKHLRELMAMKHAGHRAVAFFLVQRGDCVAVSPADTIDPTYGRLLREAADAGVELLAYAAVVGDNEILVSHRLPFILPER
jgi:sugar fermentation stimulation protein A